MSEPQSDVSDLDLESGAPTGPSARTSGAFRVSEILRQGHEPLARNPGTKGLTAQDANELRLLLRGESVVDWYRLDFHDEEDSKRLLALNSLDWDDADDRERVETLRREAAEYTRRVLKLHVDEVVAESAPFIELPLMASGKRGTRKQQRNACTLLKVMHILYHLDARELRTRLALSDAALFESVEQSVLEVFDQLRALGAPVLEFQWSRKTQDSLLTKMLVKRETSAARVFDRLRFRLIVRERDDVLPTLKLMLRRLIPFNYVVPGQTVNTLVDTRVLSEISPSPLATSEGRAADQNEFSGANFRMLNFIADLPVRVDDQIDPNAEGDRGNVVFVLVEFQLIDAETAKTNEEGEASHAAYKMRQHSRVRERLLRTPSDKDKKKSNG